MVKRAKRKFLSLIMTIGIILCMIPMSVPVLAKENLPGISKNTPIYTYTYKSSGKVYRYTNSSLNTKESGHWIDCATDLCRIIEIQNNAVKVIYPTSGGNKTGWFYRSEFCKGDLKADQAKYSFKATKTITTYRWKENNTTAGSIYKGDKVYLLRGDQNSNWLQVLYPVSGGYKMAWVKGDDLFANSIKLNKTSISKQGLGWTETLTATLSPSNSADSVSWSSSNNGVATVSGSGVVKAVGYGNATITATTKRGKTATASISVTGASVPKHAIDLNRTLDGQEYWELGEYATADIYINGVIDADNVRDYWKEWPEGTRYEVRDVKVKSGYSFSGACAGNMTGTVGSSNVDIRLVFAKASTSVAVTGIKLNKTSASVKVGSTVKLSTTLSPSNASNKSVSWSSSNTKVATVSGGTVKGVKKGTATITAKSNNGKTATCKVTVTQSNESKVKSRLDKIMNGSLTYNKNTVMKKGSKFTGYRANEQCKGYAKNVFYLCFKVTPSSTQSKPNNYKLNSTKGMKLVASYGSINATRAKKLFANARPGDFVQIRRTHTGSHSAIVYSVSSTGVTFVEANLDGKNTVYKRTYTWANLASKNAGMSVYTSTSYSLK